MSELLLKNYVAGAAVAAHRIVKPGASDGAVLQGAAATDLLIGVSTELASDSGARCDVVHAGTPLVQFGGTVTRGQPLTSDANGKAVAAAPAAGAQARIIGFALVSAVDGDIVPFLLAPGYITTPAA